MLSANRYGKSRVRLVRVDRQPDKHHVFEVTVEVILKGDFADTYITGDNAKIIPTDTQKNTVYYLAKNHLNAEKPIESFGLSICQHFLAEYKDVDEVSVELRQHRWERIIDPKTGQPHKIAFTKVKPEVRVATATLARRGVPSVTSSIVDLTVLKTCGSSFVGFPRCKLTTLPEAKDRMLCTAVRATWKYNPQAVLRGSVKYDAVHEGVRSVFLDRFANEGSGSVQQLVYNTGAATIAKFDTVDQITIALPNIHIFHFDIERFGLKNDDEVYMPVDDPAGYLEGTVTRPGAKL